MTGLRKRVAVGFLSIVFLLFFSGMISLFELSRLSRDTGEILEASKRHIDRAKEMLDAAHEQNVALIRLAMLGDRSGDTLYRRSTARLEAALEEALVEASDRSMLDSLVAVVAELRQLTDPFLAEEEAEQRAGSRMGHATAASRTATPVPTAPKETVSIVGNDATADSTSEWTAQSAEGTSSAAVAKHRALSDQSRVAEGAASGGGSALVRASGSGKGRSTTKNAVSVAEQRPVLSPEWYSAEYEVLYGRMTAAIKSYMTSTQSSLAPRAEQLKKNAYRAVTPVLISLVVMIAIVLMLYYFMSVYCVSPVVRMNKALGDFLVFRTPFAPKGEFKDEMLGVREKIETMIAMIRQNGNGK